MNYVSYAQLAEDVRFLATKLPRPQAVVGIPRSGMLPASMLAAFFDVPLSDLYTFARGGFFRGGKRTYGVVPGCGPVLVVDDSAHHGSAMRRARKILARIKQDILYAAIYRWPNKPGTVEYFARDLETPRYFAWNLYHHPDVSRFAFDIDGVLCHNPPGFDDDGEGYRQSIINAQPLYLPSRQIHTLVSMRLERWRPETEGWLAIHGIDYKRLILCPCQTAQERRDTLDYGTWKGRHYADSECSLFIESDDDQAKRIHAATGRPVFCVETEGLYQCA